MRWTIVAAALVAAFALAGSRVAPVHGQGIADPTECQVEPRSDEWVAALLATPAALDATPDATPAASPIPYAALPEGDPAGPEALFGINGTMRELVACQNAGDARRALALFTEDVDRETLATFGLLDPALLGIEAPTPLPAGEQEIFFSIRDPLLLDDGRYGAIVSRDTQPEIGYFVIFVRQDDGRWLIDEAFVTEAAGSAGP